MQPRIAQQVATENHSTNADTTLNRFLHELEAPASVANLPAVSVPPAPIAHHKSGRRAIDPRWVYGGTAGVLLLLGILWMSGRGAKPVDNGPTPNAPASPQGSDADVARWLATLDVPIDVTVSFDGKAAATPTAAA